MGFQRSHNIKSVKPFCNIHKCTTDNEINVSIQNAGLGPMLIQKVTFLKSQDDTNKTVGLLPEELPFKLNYDVNYNMGTYALASMGEVNLFKYVLDYSEKMDIELIKNKFMGHYICIKYTDVYDHNYEKTVKIVDLLIPRLNTKKYEAQI